LEAPNKATTGAAARTAVLRYLDAASGHWTVSGQHNREPNTEPTMWTGKVHDITGKYPGLWGADLSFHSLDARAGMIAEAKRQWAAGSLVTLMWHICPPTHPEPCEWNTPSGVWAKLTDAQWTEMLTPGTPLNTALTAEFDAVVPLLRGLRDAGVAVIWRPFHEMNDNWAWWGGRPGPDGSDRLYRLMHDHFQAAGLDNLVWVWDVSDGDPAGIGAYDPGPRYSDVAALDIWQTDFPTEADYQAMQKVAGERPIALGELSRVPSPEILAQQPRWVYFLIWAEYLQQRASGDEIKRSYYNPQVRNRDNLMGPPYPMETPTSRSTP
jgi:mannan endo-1,4-beta-mannosidase